MTLAIVAVLVGLLLLVGSADRFIVGAQVVAKSCGIPALVIGMVIVGFGTSLPELLVSALAALDGSPGLAIGNAYGSNIANIALILGISALICPVVVQSRILRRELPLLTAVTVLAGLQLMDGTISRIDSVVLLFVFVVLMLWTIWQGKREGGDTFADEVERDLKSSPITLKAALLWLVLGLAGLALSSRMLVWGAVVLARGMGVSEIIIGLTVVAIGTSLPELASSVVAARKGEHDLAVGNILGSNLFNTLAVVGLAGVINPIAVSAEVVQRDLLVMGLLTVSLFVLGYGFRGKVGRINRWEGGTLLIVYASYTSMLIVSMLR